MTDFLDNFDLVDRAVISLYSVLKRCLKMFVSPVIKLKRHAARF